MEMADRNFVSVIVAFEVVLVELESEPEGVRAAQMRQLMRPI